MTVSYQTYLDEILLAAANAQTGGEVQSFDLARFHMTQFPQCPPTWLTTAATALHEMGYGVDWQDTNNTSFRINGRGLLRAEDIRDEHSKLSDKSPVVAKPQSTDWGKWGAIAAWIGIPLAAVGAVAALMALLK